MTTRTDNESGPIRADREQPAGTVRSYADRFFANSLVLLCVDMFVMVSALHLGDWILEMLRGIPIWIDRGYVILPLWFAGAIVLRIVPGWGMGTVELLRRKVILLSGVFGAVAIFMFLLRATHASRISFVISYAFCLLFIPVGRWLIRQVLIRRGLWGIPVVVYGNTVMAQHVIRVTRDEPALGYNVVGVFDDEMKLGETLDGVPVLGRMTEHVSTVDVAIHAFQGKTREDLAQQLEGPLSRYRRVILVPDLLEMPSLWVKPVDFLGVLGLEIARNLLNPMARAVKSVLEWVVTLLTLPLWLPVLLLLALAIVLEGGGKPFFLQERIGRAGRLFKVVKFRTMRPDAEEHLRKCIEADPGLMQEWKCHCKLKNDPRITVVGKWLRRTSLDELPQLINVLFGQMSLVGPRPLPPYHRNQLPERVLTLREQVLPGITGLWQVSGRSDSGNEGIERWDTYYVRNWSVWLDLVILCRTVIAVFAARGAY